MNRASAPLRAQVLAVAACLVRTAALALPALLCCACGDAAAPTGPATAPASDAATDRAFEEARVRAVKLQDGGGDIAQTLQALLDAWKLKPDHYGINHRLGRLYSDQKLHERALEHFQRAFAAKPEDHDTLLTIITLQVRLGLLDEALANLPLLEQDRHLRGEALYQRATILDQRGQREQALALVQDTAGLTPEEAYRCASLHGRFLLESGDLAAAQERFRAALAGRPDYKEALKGLADCCRRLGDDTAAAHWDALLAMFLELTDNVYMKTPKARPQRREVLEKLLAAYPEWTAGFPELCDLQVELGDKAAACRTIEAFLATHGSTVPADAATQLRARYCGGAAR